MEGRPRESPPSPAGAEPSTDWREASEAFFRGRETDEFWRQLRSSLLPLVRGRLPGLPHEVEDVIAETFLGLIELRARGQYDPARGTVVSLARTIAGRRCVDRLRLRYGSRTGSLEGMAEAGPDARTPGPREPADPGPGTEERVIVVELTRARRAAFRRAFTELQQEDQRIGSQRALAVLLRYRRVIEDDDYRFLFAPRWPGADLASWGEIAQQLGQTAEAARQSGSRGLRALRQLVERDGAMAFAP